MSVQGIRTGAPLIYEGEFEFDQQALLARAQQLADNTPGFGKVINPIEIGDAGSTAMGQYKGSTFNPVVQNNQPHTWPELKGFVEWLGPVAKRILTDWEFDFDTVAITNSWVNRHGQGGWTNFHIHHNAHLALAAYIQAEENSGHLIIDDPVEPYWTGYPCMRKIRMHGGYRLPATSNKVYLFAPFLRHGTEQNKSGKDRWVISMNLQTYKG